MPRVTIGSSATAQGLRTFTWSSVPRIVISWAIGLLRQWIFSPRSSIVTNLRKRRSRVSGFFASSRR